MTDSDLQSYSIQFLECLRQYQRRNRFLTGASGTPFSLTESHVMVELQATAGAKPAELARCLGVQRSTMSRALAALAKRSLVKLTKVKGKSRELKAALTGHGERTLLERDLHASQQVYELCSVLSIDQTDQLARLIDLFCDLMGASKSTRRPDEHILRAPVRRLTRCVGILSDNLFQTGISSTTWHLIAALEEGAATTTQALAQYLNLARSTVSLILGRLKREGVVALVADGGDARRTRLSLTSKATKMLSEIKRAATHLFTRGAIAMEAKEREKLLALFSAVAHGYPLGDVMAFEGLQFGQLKSESEYNKARAFIIRELVQRKKEELAPAHLLASLFSYFTTKAGPIGGVFEIVSSLNRGRFELLLGLTTLEERSIISAFLRSVFEQFFAQKPQAELVVNMKNELLDQSVRTLFASDGKRELLLNSRNWREFL